MMSKNISKPVNMNERLFQKSLEQFPVIDYDFFNTVQFDVFYSEEYGFNLHISHMFVEENDEHPNKYGFVHRTSITKDSLTELAEVVLSFIQAGMYQDLEKSFHGIMWGESGEQIGEIDWMEELSKSDDILKIEGMTEDGEKTGEVYLNPNKDQK